MLAKQGTLSLKLAQVLAALSVATLGVSGAFYKIQIEHEAELAELRGECDAALERAAGVQAERDAYVARLEQDASSLLESYQSWSTRGAQLQEERLDLDLALREREEALGRTELRYKQALGAAMSDLDAAGTQLAHANTENERLEHLQTEILDAFGDRVLAFEGWRRSVEQERRELKTTLAYEQWRKTVGIAVAGECRVSWGARKFDKCARRVEATLLPHEKGAIECIISGYGLPFYAEDQKLLVFPENSIELKQGVVIPCDPSLHDQSALAE